MAWQVEMVGKGQYSEVYKAMKLGSKEQFAIKVLVRTGSQVSQGILQE